jgi:hypothetical protein
MTSTYHDFTYTAEINPKIGGWTISKYDHGRLLDTRLLLGLRPSGTTMRNLFR